MAAPSRDPAPEDVLAVVFPGDEWHAATMKTLLAGHPGLVPVGGGKIEGAEIWWESNSCEDEFGYDRPGSVVSQEELLQSLLRQLRSFES